MAEIDLHAVVLAGGSGTRFWPLSTPERPKQFLALFDDRSLIQHAVDRLLPLMPPREHLDIDGRVAARSRAGRAAHAAAVAICR